MGKAEKLFDKLIAGRNDANFPFDDLCALLTKLGYTARKTKGSHIIFQRGPRAEKPSPIRYARCGKSCKN